MWEHRHIEQCQLTMPLFAYCFLLRYFVGAAAGAVVVAAAAATISNQKK